MTWDEERVHTLVRSVINDELPFDELTGKITELMSDARVEAIEWAWNAACQQHAQGRDPNLQKRPQLLEMANADLNPERSK